MKSVQETSEYQLYPHCIPVSGASGRGAIYDLRTGRVFSVNHKAMRIICYQEPDDQQYWHKLAEAGLARRRGCKPARENGPLKSRVSDTKKARLRFMWCEITLGCNERCLHCYGSFGQPQEHSVDWEDVLRQGARLGCRQIQFIGGEPLLVKDLLFRLIALARELKYFFVEVFTNGTLITPQVAQYFADYGVHAAVSLYSNQPEVHDAITQRKESFQRTSDGLCLLREKAVPTRVAVIAMAHNQDTLEATMNYVKSCGASCRKPDVVRPTGRGSDRHLLPRQEIVAQYAMRNRPDFGTSWQDFARARYWNTCWKGKIAITPAGDVLPCIFARSTVVGNINQTSLASIVEGAILPYWHITLDQVAVCQACEYRYACHNCRPLSVGASGDLLGSNPRCAYDPYAGQWKEEKTDD